VTISTKDEPTTIASISNLVTSLAISGFLIPKPRAIGKLLYFLM